MEEIKSIKGLRKYYDNCSDDVKGFFGDLDQLLELEAVSLRVALAYVFSQWELAQNIMLSYCIPRIHKTDISFTIKVVDRQHINREIFEKLYRDAFAMPLPKSKDFDRAKDIRDKALHGKRLEDSDLRNAIASVLHYAEMINKDFEKKYNFKAIQGNYKGFFGKGPKGGRLDNRTTRFILKGIGFTGID